MKNLLTQALIALVILVVSYYVIDFLAQNI
jgi:hypothetical protein